MWTKKRFDFNSCNHFNDENCFWKVLKDLFVWQIDLDWYNVTTTCNKFTFFVDFDLNRCNWLWYYINPNRFSKRRNHSKHLKYNTSCWNRNWRRSFSFVVSKKYNRFCYSDLTFPTRSSTQPTQKFSAENPMAKRCQFYSSFSSSSLCSI